MPQYWTVAAILLSVPLAQPAGGENAERSAFAFSEYADQTALALSVDAERAYTPVLNVGSILEDQRLEEAVRSGLPLRLRFRIELWREGLFDALAGSEEWERLLLYDPLEDAYHLHDLSNPGGARAHADYRRARADLETAYRPGLRPRGAGTYYYTAVVLIETLNLSDLDELRRWLRGDLGPAVSGEGGITGAIGRGLQRLFVRVLRLPDRRHEVRSARFRVP